MDALPPTHSLKTRLKVTEGFNHLLKAPFSVHPKTGKICVPFLASEVDSFNLDTVPTVTSIRSEEGAALLAKSIKILAQLADTCESDQENDENSPPKKSKL